MDLWKNGCLATEVFGTSGSRDRNDVSRHGSPLPARVFQSLQRKTDDGRSPSFGLKLSRCHAVRFAHRVDPTR